MSDPIFTPEAPSASPKKPVPIALVVGLGCGFLFLASLGTCAGCGLWGAHKIVNAGNAEWTDFAQVANALGTDSGAAAAYRSHPQLSQAYLTEHDFVGAARLWRPSLSPLPAKRPSLLTGQVTFNSRYNNGQSMLVIGYRVGIGKMLVGTWTNHQLSDLQLTSQPGR